MRSNTKDSRGEAPFDHPLRITGLCKQYGSGLVAVKSIDFHVARGEIVGLLGVNGAGKTTTLRMLAGIMKPTSGDVEICGLSLNKDLHAVKSSIGFLSGDTKLYPQLTVFETLRFFGRLHGISSSLLESSIRVLIKDYNMTAYANQRVGTLSSGQMQRVNITRAILHDPEILILDEVTSSLDILSSRFIIEAIKSYAKRDKAIIFSTHIMSEAEYLCDRIAFIHEGEILKVGTRDDLLIDTDSSCLTEAFFKLVQPEECMP